MATSHYIDLNLFHRLQDEEFRREWFRSELEAKVPEMFRELREERSLTQKDLADATGMKQSAISRFERERTGKWKLETLLKLSEALDAQLDISVRKSEEVIEQYRIQESNGSSGTDTLSTSSASDNTQLGEYLIESGPVGFNNPTTRRRKSDPIISALGERPWYNS